MKKIKFTLSDAILIAISTVVGYSLAYMYELGYTSKFSIPAEYISLDTTSILSGVISVIASLLIIFSFYNLMYPFIPKKNDELSLRIGRFAPVIIISIANILFIRGYRLFYVLLVIIILEFIWPLMYKDRKTYNEKLKADREKESSTGMLIDLIIKTKEGSYIFLIIWGLCLLLLTARNYGYYQAENQRKKQIVKIDNKEYVVARIYNQTAIMLRYNRKGNKTEKIILIRGKDNLPEIHLEQNQ